MWKILPTLTVLVVIGVTVQSPSPTASPPPSPSTSSLPKAKENLESSLPLAKSRPLSVEPNPSAGHSRSSTESSKRPRPPKVDKSKPLGEPLISRSLLPRLQTILLLDSDESKKRCLSPLTTVSPYPPNKIPKLDGIPEEVGINDFDFISHLSGVIGAQMVFLVKKNNGINKGVKFAMKIVYITSTYTIKMIMNERQILQNTSGYHWATGLHYAFLLKDAVAYVIDYAPGGTVDNYINNDEFDDVAVARRFAAVIVYIFENLHFLKIYHRDFTLDNVLIGPNGEAIMADFGGSMYFPKMEYLEFCRYSKGDWKTFGKWMNITLAETIPHKESFVKLLMDDITDLNIKEVRGHAFFAKEINWDAISGGSQTPFPKPNVIDVDPTPDLKVTFKIEQGKPLSVEQIRELKDFPYMDPTPVAQSSKC